MTTHVKTKQPKCMFCDNVPAQYGDMVCQEHKEKMFKDSSEYVATHKDRYVVVGFYVFTLLCAIGAGIYLTFTL